MTFLLRKLAAGNETSDSDPSTYPLLYQLLWCSSQISHSPDRPIPNPPCPHQPSLPALSLSFPPILKSFGVLPVLSFERGVTLTFSHPAAVLSSSRRCLFVIFLLPITTQVHLKSPLEPPSSASPSHAPSTLTPPTQLLPPQNESAHLLPPSLSPFPLPVSSFAPSNEKRNILMTFLRDLP